MGGHFMKKFTSVLVTLCMFFALMGGMMVNAASGDGTTGAVTWSLDANGVFTVSGEGAMEDYASVVDVPWKDSMASIKSVIIGESVTHVSDYGFYGAVNLTSVTFQNERLYRIGEYTFYNCDNLKSVTLPKGLRELGYGAFGCATTSNGLDTAYIPARNVDFRTHYNEETYENVNAETFPVHTIIYGYPSSATNWYCENNERTFIAYEDGYVVDLTEGVDNTYEYNDNGGRVVDLWDAVKAENGSADSIMFDYTYTIDAAEIPEIHDYMVDESYQMLSGTSANGAYVQVEAELHFSFESGNSGNLYADGSYSYRETDYKGNSRDNYLNWKTWKSEDSIFSVTNNGSVLTISVNGTLKDAWDAICTTNPDVANETINCVYLFVRVTGRTEQRYDSKTTQVEYHSSWYYDAHGRIVEQQDAPALSYEYLIEVNDAPFDFLELPGFYEPVKKEYFWTYEFKKQKDGEIYNEETGEYEYYYWGWVEEIMPEDATIFTEKAPDGKEYGIARGEFDAGESNTLRIKQLLNDENRTFIDSFIGLKPCGDGGEVMISLACNVKMTFEDGEVIYRTFDMTNEMNKMVAPCVHSCEICGVCTITDRSTPCNFNYMRGEAMFYCTCDEPDAVEITVENVSTTNTTTSNIEAPVTVVVDRVDMTTATDTAFVEHVTQEINNYEIEEIYNVDIYEEYSGNPYILNQWGGSDEELTVTIPVSQENAQALYDGDAALYHIDGDGTAEAVEEFEVVINGENSSVTFTSNTFSPFVITGAEKETPAETSVTVTKDADANSCTVKY
ncbi:MAG: leucine-rich repeat domain-containing protein, partial [Ruminococcaceae bacterium]|nr:leucine-rich repeat domain-containing protein [Oscillospiraceae bacterium]